MTRPLALVTGASAGIGKEIARVLAADHDLVLSARRADELAALAAELAGTGCTVVPADLADPAAPRLIFDALAGRPLDVLVNNAGFGDFGYFAAADLGKQLRMVQVNCTALTELTHRFLPGMIARKTGRVLNVGSVAGFQPGPLMAVYYATKAYVNSLSQALSNELAGTGVTVTCLCPGPTRTEFAAAAGRREGKSFSVAQRLTARDVAEVGVAAMKRGTPVVVPGMGNKLLIAAERLLPRGAVVRAVRWMQQKRMPE
ncbi:MAG: SDR family oxidoreductase [Gemmataceae bacterium]